MLSMPLGIEHLALKSREAVQGAVEKHSNIDHGGVLGLKVTHLMLGAEGLLALQKLGVWVCRGMGQTGGMP